MCLIVDVRSELPGRNSLGIREASSTCTSCERHPSKPEPLANGLMLESVLPVLELHYE